jgi:hypothetical protein
MAEVHVHAVPARVWVLGISHRHGYDTYVCASDTLAYFQLTSYVHGWWDEVLDDDGAVLSEPPEDDEEAIRLYFQTNEDEHWGITAHDVLTEEPSATRPTTGA